MKLLNILNEITIKSNNKTILDMINYFNKYISHRHDLSIKYAHIFNKYAVKYPEVNPSNLFAKLSQQDINNLYKDLVNLKSQNP